MRPSRAGDAQAGGCPQTWLAWPWHSAGDAVRSTSWALSGTWCRDPPLPRSRPRPGELLGGTGEQAWGGPLPWLCVPRRETTVGTACRLGALARPLAPQACAFHPGPALKARAGGLHSGFLTEHSLWGSRAALTAWPVHPGDTSATSQDPRVPQGLSSRLSLRLSHPIQLASVCPGPGRPPRAPSRLPHSTCRSAILESPHAAHTLQGLPAAPSWGSEGPPGVPQRRD